ncbi:MAG: aspartoacylase [Goleter apudmare HA4340-LM2]|jgi:aspartoacylase|nr:aspartoacylase [Goleter apudmare HA4340-LM2]
MKQINKIAIVGGTHGNEFTGAYLVKKFEQYPNLIQRSSVKTVTLLSNPQAFAANKRYIDKDLNRCFSSDDLSDLTLSSHEDEQAKNIQNTLGKDGKYPVDLIVDLHSTTANMGLTIIPGSRHPFILQLAAYLSSINPEVKVCYSRPEQARNFLSSVCELGFVIEVGPVAQGVLSAEWFQKTEQLIVTILDYLERCNQGIIPQINNSLTIYKYLEFVDYPRNQNGEIQAMIHPQLQFRDYEPLHPGEPIFLTLNNQAIAYTGTSTVYPVFINEAAYYEKGIAMCLTEKEEITI